jgi:uncharacterized protein YndB with AHSA1/START domain
MWRAHHDADLMRRWLLGPDGWTMPVCDIATKVGDSYRYKWEAAMRGWSGKCSWRLRDFLGAGAARHFPGGTTLDNVS